MSIREIFPGDRGNEATQDVTSLLAAITLPFIESFGSDNLELLGLPERPDFPIPDPEPTTQLSITQCAYNSGLDALSIIKRLEDAVAGCKARLVARISGAAAVEAKLLSLDRWQNGVAASSAATEMALTLGIPEPTAAALEHHSTELVQERPQVLQALEAGELSWRHATIINDEIRTLQETVTTTPEDTAMLQARLLVLSENTTVASFMGKARRAREKMHPETISTRTKEAFAKRRLSCEADKDGMSWLNLHLPTVSASAIYSHCTSLARTIKSDAAAAQRAANLAGTGQDCHEYRTLAQLRADIAAILLMGKELPENVAAGTECTETYQGARDDQRAQDDQNGQGSRAQGNQSAENQPAGNQGWDRGPVNDYPWGGVASGSYPGDLDSDPCPWDLEPSGDEASASPAPTPATPTDTTAAAAPTTTTATPAPTSSPLPAADAEAVKQQQLEASYLQDLNELAQSKVFVDPPLPNALVLVTVPFLGLLGLTDQPAELAGRDGGPIPEDLARKLLKDSSTFLRVLTDPITGEALPLEPQRYTLRAAEKAVLQTLAGGCYVPNCPNPVMDTELDHMQAFESGGASTMSNIRPACARHHHMKHFKDDKDKHGRRRCIDEPERNALKLRGWTPKVTPDGRVGWIMPSGTYQPPLNNDPPLPQYPKWLKKIIARSLKRNRTPDPDES